MLPGSKRCSAIERILSCLRVKTYWYGLRIQLQKLESREKIEQHVDTEIDRRTYGCAYPILSLEIWVAVVATSAAWILNPGGSSGQVYVGRDLEFSWYYWQQAGSLPGRSARLLRRA